MQNSYTDFAFYYDAMMHDVDYQSWSDRINEIIRRFSLKDSNISVADCACGTGEITCRLAKLGYQTTGIDLSSDMLQVAQEKARRFGLKIPFACMDMRHLSLHKRMDVVNCSCDGVNYLTSRSAVDAFFKRANALLNASGLLLFDVSTRYKISKVLGGNCFGEDLPVCTYLWRNAYDPEEKLLQMDLNVFVRERDGRYRRFDETHVQRAHSDTELRKLLDENGFDILAAFDDLTENRASEESQRVLYVCRKREENEEEQ